MKKSKIILIGILAYVCFMILMTELNYREAITRASKMETDAEIEAVMYEYGFRSDIHGDIGTTEKFKAVYNLLYTSR